jgi:hypothetical protein
VVPVISSTRCQWVFAGYIKYYNPCSLRFCSPLLPNRTPSDTKKMSHSAGLVTQPGSCGLGNIRASRRNPYPSPALDLTPRGFLPGISTATVYQPEACERAESGVAHRTDETFRKNCWYIPWAEHCRPCIATAPPLKWRLMESHLLTIWM